MITPELIDKLPEDIIADINDSVRKACDVHKLDNYFAVNPSDKVVRLILFPIVVNCIATIVYDDANLDRCEKWLGNRKGLAFGEFPYYSLPYAGNKNIDRLAMAISQEIARDYK
jgi:hypothetical protein